nr:MAG TPA: endosialidase chaperone [Caudoviricetes sp.]
MDFLWSKNSMIKISEDIKKLYIKDGTPIELEVKFKDNAFPTIKGSDVLSEQMTLHESICEEEQLKFGGCNASSFELTVFNLNSGIKGYEIEPVLITNKTKISLGVFYVETIEKYAGKDYKKLTAYDKMRYFDVDVKDWYDNLTFPISVKNFRDSLCNYVGVEQNEAALIADNIMLTKELDSSNGINGLSLMKQICEISGVFGRMDRYGKLDYLSLESSMLLPADDLFPANDLYPSAGSGSSENSFNIPTSIMYEHPLVEDFFTSNIDGVIIVDSEGAQVVTEYNQNPYYVQDNFVIMGQTHETITALANALSSKISSISYRPINSSKIKGQPHVECGDFISGEVNGYGFEAYVFQRDLTGIKALRDSYICKGKEMLENDMNGVTAQLQRLNKTTERVKTSVQVTEKGLKSEVKRATDAENELSTRIEQTEQKIVLRVDSATGKIVQVSLIGDTGSGTEFKVDADNINLSASDVINLLSGGTINLTGKNIAITSDNFSVTKEGKMTCNDANIEGDINAKTFKSEFYYNGQKYSEMRLSAEGYEDNVGYLIMQELISILGATLRHTIITPTSVGVYEDGYPKTGDYAKVETAGFFTSGTAYLGSSPVIGSDKDVKTNIQSLDTKKSSDFIYALNPVEYKYKDGTSDRLHHGFIAQEIHDSMQSDWGVYCDANIGTGKKGGKALRYEELIADLVATVQSQNERIKELEKQIGGR